LPSRHRSAETLSQLEARPEIVIEELVAKELVIEERRRCGSYMSSFLG
jgi:hypothetical protein